ncbi:unnamed protein product, partial [Prorocentrum cordatum]
WQGPRLRVVRRRTASTAAVEGSVRWRRHGRLRRRHGGPLSRRRSHFGGLPHQARRGPQRRGLGGGRQDPRRSQHDGHTLEGQRAEVELERWPKRRVPSQIL